MKKTRKNRLERVYRGLIYALPAVLYFSYWPVITLGGDKTMNFEFSLPLIWLVVFGVVAAILMVKKKLLLKGVWQKWVWLLFPLWLGASVIWSLNPLRGLLTAGILGLLYLAVYGMWSLKELFYGVEFREKFWKVFWGSTLVVCGWCVVQCVLDLVGVTREYSLMCAGCAYGMFGFPHPNGFAIEPQFMGNLLLAPAMVAAWMIMRKQGDQKTFLRRGFLLFCLLMVTITLFLTFSRGAIYAFIVGLVVMSVWCVVQAKKERKLVAKRAGLAWGVVVLAFAATLNLQGLMAEVGPTEDTYFDGVTKVVNHLSLGVVDLKNDGGRTSEEVQSEEEQALNMEITGEGSEKSENVVVEKPVENFDRADESVSAEKTEKAVFDGYVAASTETRVKLTGAAMRVWSGSPATILFGVGLGGAGQALYINGLTNSPKEIVQNQYASLLLETGLVGVSLLVLILVMAVKAMWRNPARVMLISLVIAYGVSVCFFAGLPNALQVYLMPAVLYMVLRKKAVS